MTIKRLVRRWSLRAATAGILLVVTSTLTTAQTAQPASPAKKDAQMQRSLQLNEQGALAVKARDFQRAEQLFSEALSVDSRNITAVFNLAGMHIANDKEPQAIALLTKYVNLFPKDAGIQARLGDAYFSFQDPKNAVKAYERAFKLDPEYPGLAAKLGTLYTMQNKLPKAAAMYERAIASNSRDVQSLKNLSSVYLALKKPELAISTSKRALQLSYSADIYVTLGGAYRELHDYKNALNAFQRAQKLGHKDPNLAKVIEELNEDLKKDAA